MCDRGNLRPTVADLIRIVHRLADRIEPEEVAGGPHPAGVRAELRTLLDRLEEPTGGCRDRAARPGLTG